MVSENKRFRIVRVLMFPVAALNNQIIFFAFYDGKIHCLTSEFHGKNRYRMNHEALSTISVLRVKFTFEFTSLAMNFSCTA